uniref:RRM domain-containing protein n=1 Tax=Macrostomum lignano TaxID=282301 RepID=A0A1I8FB38_9PLAT
MSPEQIPSSVCPDGRQSGSLFTLFLHCPLSGMARLCGANTVQLPAWERGLILMDGCLSEAGRLLLQHKEVDPAYQCFFRDDFLRALLLRFLFCCLALRLHRDFQPPRCYPTAHPALPDDLLDVDSVQAKVLDLAELFDARDLFCEAAVAPSAANNAKTGKCHYRQFRLTGTGGGAGHRARSKSSSSGASSPKRRRSSSSAASSKDSSKASAKETRRSNKSKSKSKSRFLVGLLPLARPLPVSSSSDSFIVQQQQQQFVPRSRGASPSSTAASPSNNRRRRRASSTSPSRPAKVGDDFVKIFLSASPASPATWPRAHLEEIFGMYGALRRIDIPADAQHPGADSRFAIIEFESPGRSGRRLCGTWTAGRSMVRRL